MPPTEKTFGDIAIEIRDLLTAILIATIGGDPETASLILETLSVSTTKTTETFEKLKEVEREVSPENAPGWKCDHMVVPVPGTPVQILEMTIYRDSELVVRAMPTNTQNVFIGPTKGDAGDANKRVTLQPNGSTSLKIKNANLVWVDARVANEGIEYWAESY